ncbi:MAG: hypothetical protein ABIA75_04990 [Candidatus Neomarinimicrobiota bacterium]
MTNQQFYILAVGVFLLAGSAVAGDIQSTAGLVLNLSGQVIALDRGLSMRSGSYNILTLHKTVAEIEDRYLGYAWFPGNRFSGRAGNFIGRVTKYILLDCPIDYFSNVLAHEYFGHGARYRELGISDIDYGYDRPPPYGPGGGQASANIGLGVVSTPEKVAIWSGGFEVQNILNRQTRLYWFERRQIHYREAFRYFWCYQLQTNYIQSTAEITTADQGLNDPQAYIYLLNVLNGADGINDQTLSVSDLIGRQKIDLIDPFLFIAVFIQLKTYLWDGNPTASLPTLKLGPLDYLPALHLGYTPFGPEYHLENYLQLGARSALIDLRLGDNAFHQSWGGIELFVKNVCQAENLTIGLDINLWRQPELDLGTDTAPSLTGGNGGAVFLQGYFDLAEYDYPVDILFEFGYKSAGYLDGFALNAGPILLAGIKF